MDPENPQPEAASMEVEAPTEGAAREAADEAKPETTITSQPEPNAAVDQNRKRYGLAGKQLSCNQKPSTKEKIEAEPTPASIE